MIVETDFEGCLPLLRKLWPHVAAVSPIDNTAGAISYTTDQWHLIRPRYFLWVEDGAEVGCTHAYNSGAGRVRIRGTYVEDAYRGRDIAYGLVRHALIEFSAENHTAYTFPRKGTEGFYARLGFVTKWLPRVGPHSFTYAEAPLAPP
jgi:predicted GNAT family acetyltransferase